MDMFRADCAKGVLVEGGESEMGGRDGVAGEGGGGRELSRREDGKGMGREESGGTRKRWEGREGHGKEAERREKGIDVSMV